MRAFGLFPPQSWERQYIPQQPHADVWNSPTLAFPEVEDQEILTCCTSRRGCWSSRPH